MYFKSYLGIYNTLIMVYKSHLIRATLDALDFLEIFQEPWLDSLEVKKSHLEIIDGSKNIYS